MGNSLKNKLFIEAESIQQLEEALANELINEDSVVFIKEDKSIWAKGNLYPCPYTKSEIDDLIKGTSILVDDDTLFIGNTSFNIEGETLKFNI